MPCPFFLIKLLNVGPTSPPPKKKIGQKNVTVHQLLLNPISIPCSGILENSYFWSNIADTRNLPSEYSHFRIKCMFFCFNLMFTLLILCKVFLLDSPNKLSESSFFEKKILEVKPRIIFGFLFVFYFIGVDVFTSVPGRTPQNFLEQQQRFVNCLPFMKEFMVFFFFLRTYQMHCHDCV